MSLRPARDLGPGEAVAPQSVSALTDVPAAPTTKVSSSVQGDEADHDGSEDLSGALGSGMDIGSG